MSPEATLGADVEVRFVGPPGSEHHWPGPDERGIVSHVRNGTAVVVWERTTLVAAWPEEWIRPA